MMLEYIAGVSSLLAFIAFAVLSYLAVAKGSLDYLVLSLSMLLYAVGAGLEFYAALLRWWPPTIYKIYYGVSPIQVGLLGAGILGAYSLSRRMKLGARIFLAYVVIVSIVLIIRVVGAELYLEELREVFVGGKAMPREVRMLSPPLTIPGGIITIVAPLAYMSRKGRSTDTILIPLASIIVMAGGFSARLGIIEAFYLAEFIGALLLAIGFIALYRRVKAT
jgi:hypothetical protein